MCQSVVCLSVRDIMLKRALKEFLLVGLKKELKKDLKELKKELKSELKIKRQLQGINKAFKE